MVELIVGVIVIYLFVKYVLPILLVGGSLAAAVISVAAAAVGCFYAVRHYVTAIRHNLNFRKWSWEKSDEPAVRSYFFGPGYAQLKGTVQEAWGLNMSYIRSVDGFFLYRWVVILCVAVLGSAITFAVALLHGGITTIVMAITYVIFSVVWLTDRIYLLLHHIRSVCPVCHKRYLIPHFACPDCGKVHKHLVPGVYGIWKHKCECGCKLPATFFNGRSRLTAKCPHCDSVLAASDAQQIGFQLIGGSKAGKSVFLAALFHQLMEVLAKNQELGVEIRSEFRPYFEELEGWFMGGDCPGTVMRNAQMYPLILEGGGMTTKRQLSIYDIAGEMFDGSSARGEMTQAQFHHCSGFMFLLDPFSEGTLREARREGGDSLADFSSMSAETVATNFINYLLETGNAKVGTRNDTPFAVLIAKSDMREIRSRIGPARLRAIARQQGAEGDYDRIRDQVCREFLIEIGFGGLISVLESRFSNIHYFPVSAMGHSPNGEEYEPWGVMEAFSWLLPQADKELTHVLQLS